MPNFSGNWKMKHSENFEELLKALASLASALLTPSPLSCLIYQQETAENLNQSDRKKPVQVTQPLVTKEHGTLAWVIQRIPPQSLAKWESENKMVCEQRLLKGEGPKTGWSREMTNDGELILTMTADDVICTRIYIRE
ncbi:cellular retinoic acid-binding protein 2 [Chelonoidis abingdonii]|uniref:cellular retinoic acid-binding protein 2 n=1 Tax=Chelonoidis abingdonii TaxID=106734 RepID=UPI003F49980C